MNFTAERQDRLTWTVALGNQARATKICSLIVRPDPNTTQNETMILTTSPMANTAIPNPKKIPNEDILKNCIYRTANQELVDTP